MKCLYKGHRDDWTRYAETVSDDEILRRLKAGPSWDCGPHLWTIWRTIVKKEAAKRGLGT